MRLKALIFDVDGTLYRLNPVRCIILSRLIRAYTMCPRQGLAALRALRAYRRAQEALRTPKTHVGNIAETQIRLAGEWTGLDVKFISTCVSRWMEEEPLDLLALHLQKDLMQLLRVTKAHRLRLGTFSDYPAARKLSAMGLTEFFDVVVCAQDPDVQRFKPDPLGLEVTLARLGVRREEALYIGDRSEIDGATASRAGIKCVILGGRRRGLPGDSWAGLSTCRDVAQALSKLETDLLVGASLHV